MGYLQSDRIVTVFGGSGFVGRNLVRTLCRKHWRVRVAMRRPHVGTHLKVSGDVGQVQLVQANVRDAASVARAVEGVDAVVNLVGILFESGRQTFEGTQATGARNIAQAARQAGARRLVQVSAIGADANARSEYARTKWAAERAALEAVPAATIIRPSIIFGPEDGFFTRFAEMARLSPVMPLIGGSTRFQPVFVGDVAEAIANALERPDAAGRIYEIGGPRVYSMAELIRYILKVADRPRLLLPVPLGVATPLGYVVGALSKLNPLFGPPMTGDQMQLLRNDNLPASGSPGLAALGVTTAETVEAIVPTYLWRHRPYGQFHEPRGEDMSRADG